MTATASDSKQRVLDVAARLFRRDGYAGVSLRDIASEASMQAGSLYYHFRSKDEIVTTVLNIGIEMVREAVEDAVAELPRDAGAARLLNVAMRRHLETFLAFSDYTSANVRIFGQVPGEVQQANMAARRAYEALWDSIIERAKAQPGFRRDIDTSTLRLFLLGVMNASLEWFDPARGDIDALADRSADLVLNGCLQPKEA